MARSRFWLGTVAAIATTMTISSTALAHVFWLQPSSFRPKANSVLKLQLRVGDVFPGDAIPRNESKIITFVSIGPDGERKVGGIDGSDVAGFERLTAPGISVIGYTAQPSEVALEAEKFETYLREKGLEKISTARAAAGESSSAVHEIYTRCAKTVVRVGEQAGGFDRVVGLRLEIIPENDPTSLRPGDDLRARVLFDGKPLAGAMVEARSPTSGTEKVSARTDNDGRVAIKLSAAGMWVVDTVEMIRVEPDSAQSPATEGGSAKDGAPVQPDWHSFWASLCLSVSDDATQAGATDAAPKSTNAAGK